MATIKIKTEVEREVEIEFPAFYRRGHIYYQMNSVKSGLRVTTEKDNTSVEESNFFSMCFSDTIEKGEKITEEEFQCALATALETLKDYQHQTVGI